MELIKVVYDSVTYLFNFHWVVSCLNQGNLMNKTQDQNYWYQRFFNVGNMFKLLAPLNVFYDLKGFSPFF